MIIFFTVYYLNVLQNGKKVWIWRQKIFKWLIKFGLLLTIFPGKRWFPKTCNEARIRFDSNRARDFSSRVESSEGEILLGITARSILEFFGIPWNYFWNSTKICIKFHWNSWNYCGITGIIGIPLGLLHDEKFQLFPPRSRVDYFSRRVECFTKETKIKNKGKNANSTRLDSKKSSSTRLEKYLFNSTRLDSCRSMVVSQRSPDTLSLQGIESGNQQKACTTVRSSLLTARW